ncbi:sigma-70 family RNA polymerase sigma factor [Streptomyces sp. AS58]|uniref:sigma-70 family RNA polymerase sigma factor n=1 Tax=Streptomyces sp. AS58 TaxID=1519489 RepID=UPI001F2BEA7C|nr:sigma-70 family RNA polymerase sigma factor [Streptomyces sp. AS58]
MGGTLMTTDTEAGTPAVLHEALVTAAGAQRALTPVALRGLLAGVDTAVVAEALGRVMTEGIALPPAAVAAFGLHDGPAVASSPSSLPPMGTAAAVPAQPRALTGPVAGTPTPRFTIEVDRDSRLDLAALTMRTLRPGSEPVPRAEVEDPEETSAEQTAAPVPSVQPIQTRMHPVEPEDLEGAASQAEFNAYWYYRNQIAKFPLLSRQREAELARAIEAGVLAREKLAQGHVRLAPKLRRELKLIQALGEQALHEFTEANLRLVVSVALKHTWCGLELLDLIQEGNLGLLHAVEMFDYQKGNKFSTYAVHWIRQAITRAIADQSRTIRVPAHAHETLNTLHRAARELGHDSPADALAEVAARAGTSAEEAEKLLSRVRCTVPLEVLAEAIGDDALHEEFDRTTREPQSLEDEPDYMNLTSDEVHRLLDRLSPREAQVLALRHGLQKGGSGLTLEAIGWQLGVTRERVRQIEKVAAEVLRDLVVAYKLSGSVLPARAVAPSRDRPLRTRKMAAPTVAKSSVLLATAASFSDTTVPLTFTSERHRVDSSGYITVEGRKISVGAGLRGGTVVVLVEQGLFRVIHDGRQLTTAPRRGQAPKGGNSVATG